jgi:hypothetical protein
MFTLLRKTFSRSNVTKLLIIFSAALSTRYFVNSFFDINVFSDFTNPISLIYYFLFSTFVVTVQQFVDLKPISLSSLEWIQVTFNTSGSNGGVGPNNGGPLNKPSSTTNDNVAIRNYWNTIMNPSPVNTATSETNTVNPPRYIRFLTRLCPGS